ncbi:MAG: Ig-like domain repeat protein [Janthinobacterium lividum]
MQKRSLLAITWALCGLLGLTELRAQPSAQVGKRAPEVSEQVELPGTAPSWLSPDDDLGPVDPALPLGRMTLLLQRSPERTVALDAFLAQVYTLGSPGYHQWITPQQFGQRFGPDSSDLAAVTTWLQLNGLRIQAVSAGRQMIQFTGTVGQFNRTFLTRIDHFRAGVHTQDAQATPLHIPSSLASSILAVSPLRSDAASASITNVGHGDYKANLGNPQWTQAGSITPRYALAPADVALQYDFGPVYAAGYNGAGKTIGIIGKSNLNTAAVDTFRSIFGLSKSPVQIIVDGEDPGMANDPTQLPRDLNDDPTVSYLGVEVAGGLAPGAQVRLYVSAGSNYQDPLLLAAQRAVDDNQADVLSLGYSECETLLGNGNTLYNALWQQAAAQGQTVVVAAGYTGSAGCQSPYYGPQANGIGSTPWNLSVGGTDFFYSDFATGGASANGLWNSTNDPITKASLKATLPEQTWNDMLGQNAVPVQLYYTRPWAGGGAPSACGVVNQYSGTFTQCVSGWPKPAWQSAVGVPQDGVRDTPDVSLFAGDGQNLSAYAICQFTQDCIPDVSGNFSANLVGGTSAAAPVMAAMMALVDQKYGRQGQPAPVLYTLARTAPAVFHDIRLGGNQIPCTVSTILSPCITGPNGSGETAGYSAGPGYDLATGLGSIDVTQLLQHWADLPVAGSNTTLQLSSSSIQHGQQITVSAKVTGSNGGTPTGTVALIANSPLPAQQGQGVITLQGGTGSAAFGSLPGGTYQLTGRYAGDQVYDPSLSAPVTVTITPEASTINFQAGPTGHYLGSTFLAGAVASYGEPIQFTVHPVGTSSGTGGATGSATFTLNTASEMIALNAGGYGSWTPSALPVGQYTASAAYAGDASFAASNSGKLPFSVIPGVPFINIDTSVTSTTVHLGDGITVGVTAGSQQVEAPGTLAPTGQVAITLGNCQLLSNGNPQYQSVGTLATPVGTSSIVSSALLQLSGVAAGEYCLRVVYGGDKNWQSNSTLVLRTITVLPTAGVPTTTALQITPTSIVAGQTTTMIATVSAPTGATTAPSGSVTFYDNGSDGNGYYTFFAALVPTSGTTSIAELTKQTASYFFNNGINHMSAVYSGDTIYSPSTSPVVDLTAVQQGGDFKLEASASQVTLAAGKSSTVVLNLTSLVGFAGTVNLACQPSSTTATCSITPGSVALNGTATAMLSFNAYTAQLLPPLSRYSEFVTVLACILVLCPRRRARWQRGLLCGLGLIAAMGASGCGSGGSPLGGLSGGTTGHPTAAGSYTVSVTAGSGLLAHNLTILVTVQ